MLRNFTSPEAVKEIIKNEDLVVALFSDLGCNVCLSITPDLEEMSQSYAKAQFISADVETIKALVGEYMVFVYPTIIIFAQGKETKRFERVFSIGEIEATVSRFSELLFG
ncbi:thioredoxin family protein [Fusibacter bizertensis]|uniref:Thioredoxin family protein n=1 Tax=Fusibacter bizertensis TaxID=1488331 RepID=A0ABT6NGI6_9FIRM|nr:thioredoxin family protein [Fusibacter bizertensis]MDH8679539.1 thioredoxin family protein [Fusibacter bizertensis]